MQHVMSYVTNINININYNINININNGDAHVGICCILGFFNSFMNTYESFQQIINRFINSSSSNVYVFALDSVSGLCYSLTEFKGR